MFHRKHVNVGLFADEKKDYARTVCDPDGYLAPLSEDERTAVTALLSADPRPSYQSDPDREYGMEYGSWEIRFTADDETAHLHVTALLSKKHEKR